MILERRSAPHLLSLVLPCYNEAEVLPLLRTRLEKFLPTLGLETEVIFIDDGSRDGTLEFLLGWAAADARVRVLGLARNFGHQNAATAGLDVAHGAAVVLLDADLQDPLEVIPLLLEKYQEGYDVVYGQRTSREGETWLKRGTAWLFYRLMTTFIHPELPPDTGDFRLMSQRCLEAVRSLRETHRFLRGMVAWVGFSQVAVPYRRLARPAGQTKYPFWKMVLFAWDAVVSFSPLPLRISLAMGGVTALAGFTYGIYAVIQAAVFHDTVPGWTTQIVLTSLLGGAILISNGLLGEYLSRIYEELKGRPLYLVARTANLERLERNQGERKTINS